ncbi:hypothetical protein [Pedobacter sp. SYSU D00535]|uniref:hypothetical protein n=1 Tax=Pedobacter sp. SYSU D00535 TaxID=2810308 RepID=UPI001A969CB8|nr:hypothetical protein [Pedobacter sp. SYSU D00535]
MIDFKVEYDDRIYSVFLDSSHVTPETVEVKVVLYSTIYNIYKKKDTNTWHNHISKFELSKGLLEAIGARLEEHLKI